MSDEYTPTPRDRPSCEPDTLPWAYDDGGAGAGPEINDCVARAIAIATGRRYGDVSDMVDEFVCAAGAWAIACKGVPFELTELLMSELGWRWVPLRNASLVAGRLPDEPRLIADMLGHVCAVIDGVVRDTFDCSWDDDGQLACVLGVYLPPCPVDDGWHRLKLAAETGALRALICQSVSDPDGDECYCDYCLIGDSWKCKRYGVDYYDLDKDDYYDLDKDDYWSCPQTLAAGIEECTEDRSSGRSLLHTPVDIYQHHRHFRRTQTMTRLGPWAGTEVRRLKP